MPYTMALVGPLLRIELRDILNAVELHQLADEIEHLEPALPTTPDRIVDLRPLRSPVVDFSSMLSLAERRRAAPVRNAIRPALVADSPVAIGYSRMFQTLVTNPKIELRVFQTMDEAEAWIAATG